MLRTFALGIAFLGSAAPISVITDAAQAQSLSAAPAPLERASAQTVKRLQAGERVRVLVMMDPAELDDTRAPVTEAGMLRRAEAIARARDTVLSETFGTRTAQRRFDALQQNAASILRDAPARAFSITPAFAAQLSAEEISAIAGHRDVALVVEDEIARPLADASVPLVGADAVWSAGFEGASTSVAILDTGVEVEHPMTGAAVTASACFSSNVDGVAQSLCPSGEERETELTGSAAGDSCVEDDLDAVDGVDGCFHGTHVASTAAGRTVNLSSGTSLNGVARQSGIVAVNVFSRFEPEECGDGETEPCVQSYSSDQLAALEWLYAHRDALNLRAVNMSLGGGEFASACTGNPLRSIMRALRNEGIATVVSSGNDGYTGAISGPACIPEAISVGATSLEDTVASFTNASQDLDLLAPGVRILGAWQSERPAEGQNCIIQDADPGADGECHWFSRSSGTSMAAPHVAGGFALLSDAFPTASVDRILEVLKFTGVQVADSTGLTRSRIALDEAYALLDAGAAPLAGVSMTPLRAFRTSGEAGQPSSFGSQTYTFSNTSSQSRTVRVNARPDWISVSRTSLSIAGGGSGTLNFSVNTNRLPRGAASGVVELAAGGDTLSVPVSINVISSFATAEFGPFEWTGDADNYTSSVFRITGLTAGVPTALDVALDQASSGAFTNDFADCSLQIRADRYSGAEYIVSGRHLADCGAFGRADVRFRIEADADDVNNGMTMRRFTINGDGGITDYGFDGDGRSVATAARLSVDAGQAEGGEAATMQRLADPADFADARLFAADETDVSAPASSDDRAVFGPFEWVEDATASTGSLFRIVGLDTGAPGRIDIAVRNATAGSYADTFADCSLQIRSARYEGSEYLITQQDVADCGAFGRADMRFRVTADPADIADGLTMRRFALSADGGMSDFAFDQNPATPRALSAIDSTIGQVGFGPFEWTGDADAATQSVFRITGFDAVGPVRIDVAVGNSALPGYIGNFDDCRLTIRPARLTGGEYLITGADLADCGSFGRGDLRFRIRGELADVPDGLSMRRLAVGAAGDLTNFGFDHLQPQNGRGVSAPNDAPGGTVAVEFGPFEWVGDSDASTRGVFRIAGLRAGAPASIDLALVNATADGFAGKYSDCRLEIRPVRSTERGYVITSNDLADCGSFERADILFRVVADDGDVWRGLTMRRFAVTTNGGLTDFGFDQ